MPMLKPSLPRWRKSTGIMGKELAERREYKRFRAQDRAFAAFISSDKRIGQIIDISRGGLAVFYLDETNQENSSFELEIFSANNGFHLKQVPFKTISDFEIPSEFHISFISMRRRSVQFGKLSHSQTSQLEYFITNYTLGEI